MPKKKRKDIPYHIAHDYEQFEWNGITFWAQNEEDSKLYIAKMKMIGVIHKLLLLGLLATQKPLSILLMVL